MSNNLRYEVYEMVRYTTSSSDPHIIEHYADVFISIFHKHAFAFAMYLSENYEWIDNTENGDIYNDTQNNIVTEKEIFNKWLNDKK